jgi:general stress protein 26
METMTAGVTTPHTGTPPTAGTVGKQILRQLRRQHFAVLSTTGADGRPASAGVSSAASLPDQPLTFYIMTRRHLQKARNIAQEPEVALVVPVRRWFLWFLPPATIQLRGRAQILEATDAEGRAVFQKFWLGRRIVKSYDAMERRGETRVCFLKITPDPLVRSYMVGSNVVSLVRHMEAGAGRLIIPTPANHP